MNKDQINDPIEILQGHYISPDDLCIGIYVHLDLGWMDHPFSFSNFMVNNEEQIRKIRALNLKKIRYDPLRSKVLPKASKPAQPDAAVTTVALSKPTPPDVTAAIPTQPVQPDVTSPTATPSKPTPPDVSAPAIASSSFAPPTLLQRAERLKKLNAAVLDSEKSFAKTATASRDAIRILTHNPENSRKIVEQLIDEMVNSAITENNVVLHAISSNNASLGNFVHPLNVAVLALMLAKSLDMREDAAARLGVAAMFHDAGKEDGPKNKSFVNMHSEAGARVALRLGLSENISKIIAQHHEYRDGSGLPMGLRDNEIDPLARILILTNHFDNLCNPPNPDEAMTPYEALSHMYTSQAQKFDPTLLKLLVKLLGVYPPGSVVQLSNGVYGIVIAVNADMPFLPLVMIYVPEVARETPVIVDLSEEASLRIKACLRPAQLPIDVFCYLKPSKRISYYFLNKSEAYGVNPHVKNAFSPEKAQQDQVLDPKVSSRN